MKITLPLLVLLPSLAFAADIAALPQTIAPDDAHLHYSGRWDHGDQAGPRCGWPACQVRFNLDGTAANVVLDGPEGQAFQVVIDGQPTSIISLVKGQTVYPVAAGLDSGKHAFELCKRTETWSGSIQVRGIQLPANAHLLDAPVFKRRIEFLGDSITCGLGNEGKAKDDKPTAENENGWNAWGSIAARSLDAELSCEAVSGIWLMDNGKNTPLPKIWKQSLPFAHGEAWNFATWIPDAVVIDLGTNDAGKPIAEQPWRDAYTAFIKDIRGVYPQAHIFLTIGPMGYGKTGEIPGYNAAIADACAAAGGAKVHALKLALQKQEDGIGAAWHPSVKTDGLMAAQIVAAVKTELGW